MQNTPYKRVLITGNLGFIGRLLQPALKSLGHTVFGFDIQPPSEVDGTDLERVRQVVNGLFPKPDIIVHLAANTSSKFAEEQPYQDFSMNAVGTLVALEIAREHGAGLIYPSTYKVEPDDKGSRSPYGISKYIGELLCKEWRATFGVKTVINRISNLYGAHEGGDKFFVNVFAKKAANSEPVEVWGDGSATRNLLYVDDLVRLLVDQVNHFDKYAEKTGYYEVSGDSELSINQLLSLLEYRNVVRKPALLGDKAVLRPTNDDVRHVTGWQPTVTLSDGINLVKKYYEKS